MKQFGPKTWCEFIAETGKKLNIPDNITVFCLNPTDEKEYRGLVDSLHNESLSGQIILISSTTPYAELKQDPLISPYINEGRFVDMKKNSMGEYLKTHFPAS